MSDKPAGAKLQLSEDVVTGLDLSRIIREAEKLDDFLYQAKLRNSTARPVMPKTTITLEKLAESNGLSLTNAEHRQTLITHLNELKKTGKKLHISFAVEPAPAVVQKIVIWLRRNIHSGIIVDVGVQPTISVGCVVRTENKVFDMSLRHRFKESGPALAELLEKMK